MDDGAKISNTCWFQLLKCQDLFSFIINEESLGFRLLVGKEKQFEAVPLRPGKLRKIKKTQKTLTLSKINQ